MFPNFIQKTFDIREGEFKVALWMLFYIFLIIAVLLIIKPAVNALFLSELGVEQLPFAFLIVAVTAVGSSFLYSKVLSKYALNKIIEFTLLGSVVVLLGLGTLLYLNYLEGGLLYFFYVWVAIYAVLSTSQFWVLANLVFNVREAKRLFGFIGSGAILGGIFGGYMTSLLAPIIGNENLIFLAAILLVFCFPLLRKIWKSRVSKLGKFKEEKRTVFSGERPFQLIKKSRHLTYMAAILAVSVIVAKLVDYLFSDFATASISDPEELTSFFAFWFSTFNLVALGIQLFFTQRIVGIWGVGFSLLLLPIGIIFGCIFFLILPELSAVVVIKAMDGALKQSVHKSASELLALPLPFDLKNRTKSFIDVVVDSIATGIAGCLLLFVVKAFQLPSYHIAILIILLVLVWIFFIGQVRKEYYKTFRQNLELLTKGADKPIKFISEKASVLKGMQSVFKNGREEQVLFMLKKLMEINDKRFESDVRFLLKHTSTKVRTAALKNLYFLNNRTMITGINELLTTNDQDLTVAALEYLLKHASHNSSVVYDLYLNHDNAQIAEAALYCLAWEARDNPSLKLAYRLRERIHRYSSTAIESKNRHASLRMLLRILGAANLPEFYPIISEHLGDEQPEVKKTAISAAGTTMDARFVSELIIFLGDKNYRTVATMALLNYGPRMIAVLSNTIHEKLVPLESCRLIPSVIKDFGSQVAIQSLFRLLEDEDLGVRLEAVRALSTIRKEHPELKFSREKVVSVIFDECKLQHLTLSAMHAQIIISYRNRKRSRKEITQEERDARGSLLELLERRLDAGLERIFKLLGLRYHQKDVEIAYEGLLSNKQEAQTNAIEFLDNLLTGTLKRALLPIIEETSLDISSEEALHKIRHKVPSELECFRLILEGNDLKLKLAVLFLMQQQKELKYLSIVEKYIQSNDFKLRTFAIKAATAIQNNA